MCFAHLHLHTPYSFLDGGSKMEALVRAAVEAGCPALAITDHNSLAGAVQFNELCEGYGIQPIHGAELTLEDASHLTLLARNRAGYASLCRLISLAYAHGGRLTPSLPWEAIPTHTEGLICLTGCRKGLVPSLIREKKRDAAEAAARRLLDWFGPESLFIELIDDFTPESHRVCQELAALADRLGVRDVATNNVHHAARRDVVMHDILRCIGAGITVGEAHEARPLNFERWLKPPAKMQELFWWRPQAIANTLQIAGQCSPSLPLSEQVTPSFNAPGTLWVGRDSAEYLRHLVGKGALARYKTLTPQVEARLRHELSVIIELGYADYMLLAWKVARWSRSQGIRCTGRGSAADSCVAYALKLTDVDVIQRDLPFARFLAPGKKPDVDLDFDSTRRDDVFEYIKKEWGEPNVAMACTYHTYHAKGALRDVGKALGLSADSLRFFSENVSNFTRADQIQEAFGRDPGLKGYAHLKERFALMFDLCTRISGFPRHIGTHSSGVVISCVPLDTIAPVSPTARGVMPLIQLDKDDAETVGAIKLDILSLRILSAVQDADIDIQRTSPAFRYDRIPREDEETYKLIQSGKAMGAFQLESPAQMALAVVLEPRQFEDLVASVALIRPGPIQSGAVKKFVACRNGYSRADALHPCLMPVLRKTFGCLIFQEQVVQVIAVMLQCSDAEADLWRKRLAKHDKNNTMDQARAEFIGRASKCHPDLSPKRAQLIWEQVETWCGYGFTEGHAASFALTAQKSAFLVRHHPAEYFAAMMSHQPMGYYASNTLAAEARRRGITILPLDINASADKCFAETPDSIRLGLRTVQDLREADIEAIVKARAEGPFVSLLDCCARVALHRDRVENLILCGAFDQLHSHRRGLLWRLGETLGLANTYRAASQPFSNRGPANEFAAPNGTKSASADCDLSARRDTLQILLANPQRNVSPPYPPILGDSSLGATAECLVSPHPQAGALPPIFGDLSLSSLGRAELDSPVVSLQTLQENPYSTSQTRISPDQQVPQNWGVGGRDRNSPAAASNGTRPASAGCSLGARRDAPCTSQSPLKPPRAADTVFYHAPAKTQRSARREAGGEVIPGDEGVQILSPPGEQSEATTLTSSPHYLITSSKNHPLTHSPSHPLNNHLITSSPHHPLTLSRQLFFSLGPASEQETPCAWDIEDFSPWDKFLWEWRITGVAIGCHPMAYLREQLNKHKVMTTHEAMQQAHGTRVTVAGLNLRPHRPPTRSGRIVLYTTIEDETEYLQATCANKALDDYAPVFLLSPAIIVRGILQRKGVGCNLYVEKAKPLRFVEFNTAPAVYPVPGTSAPLPVASAPLPVAAGGAARELMLA